MTEKQLIKAVKGLFIFIAFIVMGIAIPDINNLTLSYLQYLGIHPRLFQFMFFISAFANLIIGINDYKWNGLFIAVWVMYTSAAVVGFFNNSGTPILALAAYVLLSAYMLIDVLEDADLFDYIGNRLWKREVS